MTSTSLPGQREGLGAPVGSTRALLPVCADRGKRCTTRVRRIFLDTTRQEAAACVTFAVFGTNFPDQQGEHHADPPIDFDCLVSCRSAYHVAGAGGDRTDIRCQGICRRAEGWQADPRAIHASWCPTCKAQAPILSELRADPKFKNLAYFVIDFDSQKDLVNRFGARMQSTLIAFKGDKEEGRSVGDTKRDSIYALVGKSI